jgi:hypothetical protein
VVFREVFVLQLVEKLEAEGLRRRGRIPKEVAILLVGCDAVPPAKRIALPGGYIRGKAWLQGLILRDSAG